MKISKKQSSRRSDYLAETMLNPEVISELLFCVKIDVAFEWAKEGVCWRRRRRGRGGRRGQVVLHR